MPDVTKYNLEGVEKVTRRLSKTAIESEYYNLDWTKFNEMLKDNKELRYAIRELQIDLVGCDLTRNDEFYDNCRQSFMKILDNIRTQKEHVIVGALLNKFANYGGFASAFFEKYSYMFDKEKISQFEIPIIENSKPYVENDDKKTTKNNILLDKKSFEVTAYPVNNMELFEVCKRFIQTIELSKTNVIKEEDLEYSLRTALINILVRCKNEKDLSDVRKFMDEVALLGESEKNFVNKYSKYISSDFFEKVKKTKPKAQSDERVIEFERKYKMANERYNELARQSLFDLNDVSDVIFIFESLFNDLKSLENIMDEKKFQDYTLDISSSINKLNIFLEGLEDMERHFSMM